MIFSATEKAAELQRELGVRRRVYPDWILQNKLKEVEASRRIKILEEIVADYEILAQREKLL